MITKPDTVVFDPTNKEHRAAVRAFMRRKAWSDSPIKFKHDPDFGSIADQVQTKLLKWYLDQEGSREEKRLAAKGVKPEPKGKPAKPELHAVKKPEANPEIPRNLLKRA